MDGSLEGSISRDTLVPAGTVNRFPRLTLLFSSVVGNRFSFRKSISDDATLSLVDGSSEG